MDVEMTSGDTRMTNGGLAHWRWTGDIWTTSSFFMRRDEIPRYPVLVRVERAFSFDGGRVWLNYHGRLHRANGQR